MMRKSLLYGFVAVLCLMILIAPVMAEQTTYQMNGARTGLADDTLTVNIVESSDMDGYIAGLSQSEMVWMDMGMLPMYFDYVYLKDYLQYSSITAEVIALIKEGKSLSEVVAYVESQSDQFFGGGIKFGSSVTFSEVAPAVILGPDWSYDTSLYHTKIPGMGAVGSTAVLADGKAYFVTSPTENETLTDDNIGVYCVNIGSKTVEWYNSELRDGGISGLTLVDGKLYLGSLSGKLYCLGAVDGKILWTSDKIDQTVNTGLSSTPLVLGDTVYVTTQTPAALWAFSSDTGTEIYNNTVESAGYCVALLSSPSTDGNRVFSAGTYGISAYDPSSQTNTLLFPLSEPAGTPVYANNNIFFGTASSLYSINATTGEQNWKISHDGYATSPSIKGHTLIANGPNGLTAYNTETGACLWTHVPHANEVQTIIGLGERLSADDTTITVSQNSPIIVGDMAFYTANIMDGYMSGCLYGVNLSDGTEPEETSIDATVRSNQNGGVFHPFTGAVFNGPITTSSPAVSYNMLFIGTGSSRDSIGEAQYLADGLFGLGLPGTFTKYFSSGAVTVPPSLTLDIQGMPVSYATPLGLLVVASGDKSETITVSENTLTSYDSIENDATNMWNVRINGDIASDITTNINDGDRVLFYYGPTVNTGDALYAVQMTTDIANAFAEISIKPDYKRAFTPAETAAQTMTAVVTDWQGTVITPDAGELEWTSTSNAFQLSPSGLDLTYTPTGAAGDSAVFTLTYTPTAGDGSSVSVQTEPISIYQRTSPIKTDDSIETTIDYFTWKGNYARTGVANGTGPVTSDILWDVEFPAVGTHISLVSGSPSVYDGKVYVSVWDGGMSPQGLRVGVFCFDVQTGEEIWNNPSYQSRSGLTVQDGKVYTSGGSCLVCLDANDGHLIWQTKDISLYAYVGLTTTPVVYNGVVYVQTSTVTKKDGAGSIVDALYGFDAETGEQVFRMSGQVPDGYSGGAGMFASPSMSPDGVLYVPGAGGVYAVDTSTNAKLWEFDSGARSTKNTGSTKIDGGNNMYVGGPVYKNQSVYFIRGGYQDTPSAIYCIDAVAGTENWHKDIGLNSAPITPVITDDKLITLGAGVRAYDLSTGEELWYVESDGSNRASPIVAGDIVYYGTYTKGYIYAININTGKEVWHYQVPKTASASENWWSIVEATPAIENGILYIGAENGHFYAFKTPTLEGISFSAPAEITAGTKAVLTGSNAAGSTSASYNWDFGDGTKGTGAVVSKTWKTAGTYTVNVTAVLGDQSGVGSRTVTVKAAPAALTDPKQAVIIVLDSVPDDRKPVLVFDTGDSSADTIAVTISAYKAIAPEGFTPPPNSAKTVLYLTVDSVEGVTDKTSLKSYAKLTVNLSVGADTRGKLSF